MASSSRPCSEIDAILTQAEDHAAPLPDDPLSVLAQLHRLALRYVLVDLACARRVAEAAWSLALRLHDKPLVWAQAHWTMGSALAYVPDPAGALAHYDAALAAYSEACRSYMPAEPPLDVRIVHIPRVFCLTELGRYQEAIEAVAAAETWLETHPLPYARLTLLLNQSLLAGRMGDYERMVELADATSALAESLDETSRAAQGWINRAHACVFLSRLPEAEEALEKGIALARVAGEDLTVARARWNRARLLRCQGQLFEALRELRAAQIGLAQAPNEAATVALEEAGLYERLRQLPEARRAAVQAATQFADQSMAAYSADAALLAVRIAMEQKSLSAARMHLAFVIAQAERTALPALNAEIDLAVALQATTPLPGVGSRKQRQLQREALVTASDAVVRLSEAGFVREAAEGELVVAALNAAIKDSQTARAIYKRLAEYDDRQISMQASAALAMMLPPSAALPYARRATELASAQRRALPMEELQARYSSETSPYHLQLAALQLNLGEVYAALEATWEAKAGSILHLRAAAGKLDSTARAVLDEARIELAQRREQLDMHVRRAWEASQQDQAEQTAFHTQRAETARASLRESEQWLTDSLRIFGEHGAQGVLPTPDEALVALPAQTALIEFAEIEGALVSFLLRRNCAVEYRPLGAIAEVAPLLDYWKITCDRLIKDASPNLAQQIRAATAPLWQRLIAPWEAHFVDCNELIIAPCGELYHIPWAALWDGKSFLSERLNLQLTPSGGVWAAPYDLPAAQGMPRLLGFPGNGERQLTHVETELYTIAQHLRGAEIECAARGWHLQAEPPPRLLHIAAHALTNPAAPLCSTIELADGPFLLLEAHRLNLRGTTLVALSACETGVRPDHGDMALALAGAFLCAGARAVLASLWSVTDTAAVLIMDKFYAAFAGGATPAEALRQAQQAVREEHPLDWAAFQVWTGAS